MILKLFIVFCLVAYIRADIPSSCDPETLSGTWYFFVGPVVDRLFNCSSLDIDKTVFQENVTINLTIETNDSHTVYINDSIVGRWTSMDVEGFDIFVKLGGVDLHYQAYFNFTQEINDENKTCYVTNCSQTIGGWVRKDIVHPDDFQCFYGKKSTYIPGDCIVVERSEEEMYVNNHRIGRKYVKPHQIKPMISNVVRDIPLPDELDWTDFNGLNYVSPVYDQARCGSCFAFGSLSALEARFFIQSNRTIDVSLSQQDIVSCSHYSQGCDGGYGQEVGSWAKDHGIVTSKCLPYVQYRPAPAVAVQPACSVKCLVDNNSTVNADRIVYASKVSYVGGYCGGCNEQLMQEALQDGPIAVSLCASAPEFHYATRGTIVESNSTCPCDHTVLLVGYGTDNGVPFWKIKNSWGTAWGDDGYMRVLRGENTLQIESEAEILEPGYYTYTPPSYPSNSKDKLDSTEKALLGSTIALAIGFLLAVVTAIVLAVLVCNKPKEKTDYAKYGK